MENDGKKNSASTPRYKLDKDDLADVLNDLFAVLLGCGAAVGATIATAKDPSLGAKPAIFFIGGCLLSLIVAWFVLKIIGKKASGFGEAFATYAWGFLGGFFLWLALGLARDRSPGLLIGFAGFFAVLIEGSLLLMVVKTLLRPYEKKKKAKMRSSATQASNAAQAGTQTHSATQTRAQTSGTAQTGTQTRGTALAGTQARGTTQGNSQVRGAAQGNAQARGNAVVGGSQKQGGMTLGQVMEAFDDTFGRDAWRQLFLLLSGNKQQDLEILQGVDQSSRKQGADFMDLLTAFFRSTIQSMGDKEYALWVQQEKAMLTGAGNGNKGQAGMPEKDDTPDLKSALAKEQAGAQSVPERPGGDRPRLQLERLSSGEVYTIDERVTLIGNESDSDLVIDDPGLDGVSAVVLILQGRWCIANDLSPKPLTVNGRTMHPGERAMLRLGDRIRIADRVDLVVTLCQDPEA